MIVYTGDKLVGNSVARLFYKDKPIIGLDISQTGMKLMAVDTKKWLVTAYSSIDLEPNKVQASLDGADDYLANNLNLLKTKHLVGQLGTDHVAISIPTNRTYTRSFSLPIEATKNLQEAIDLEIDQYIPLPSETLYVDSEIVAKDAKGITVSVCAVPRTIVDRCVQITEASNLVPCLVEPGINSIARLLEMTEQGHLPTVIIDIGPAATDIAILDGSIRVTGSIPVGSNTFTLDIAKRLKVPLESAHQLKVISGLSAGPRQQKIKSALLPSLERILSEVRKVIKYYTERLESSAKLEQVLVVGAGSNVPGIGEFFTNELVMPARVASPWQQLNFGKLSSPAKQFRSRYITVAGLASVNPEEILL